VGRLLAGIGPRPTGGGAPGPGGPPAPMVVDLGVGSNPNDPNGQLVSRTQAGDGTISIELDGSNTSPRFYNGATIVVPTAGEAGPSDLDTGAQIRGLIHVDSGAPVNGHWVALGLSRDNTVISSTPHIAAGIYFTAGGAQAYVAGSDGTDAYKAIGPNVAAAGAAPFWIVELRGTLISKSPAMCSSVTAAIVDQATGEAAVVAQLSFTAPISFDSGSPKLLLGSGGATSGNTIDVKPATQFMGAEWLDSGPLVTP